VATALKPDAPPSGLASRRHGIGFWLAGYVFAIAFSAVPAPLYVLKRWPGCSWPPTSAWPCR
jgi:hypothetical protein